jgi:acyl-coenzyme A synthetase/AMP-(fatty) acid ligase
MNREPDWIATPHLRPDFRGPAKRPYLPCVDPAVAPPLVEMFRGLVARHPDRVAIEEDDGRTTSYAALWADVCRTAALIEAAPAADGPVAILLPAGPAYGAAVYACLAAGRPCLLMDDAYPEARNAFIAARTDVRLVVTTTAHAATLAWPGVQAIAVSSAGAPAGALPELTRVAHDLDAAAFILCTSGSTGEPKPIAHSQRTLLHWVRTIHDALHLGDDDRLLSLSSLSSLGGITGLLNGTLSGACVQMLDVKARGLTGLRETLASRPVTILRAAPSMLRVFARLPGAREALAGVRVVQTYGEPLMKAELAEWQPLLAPGCLLRTTYGSTEASGFSGFVDSADTYDPHRVFNGVLMPDTLAAIVDDDGNACAPEVEGELWIRSRYNALGEWHDGGLVPGRLVPHASGDGTRVYRTGDLARFHPDGAFVVLGRRDRMVNVNGQRLEPAEIEAVLRREAGVEDSEVIAHGEGEGRRLIAFVVARPGASTELLPRLRGALRDALPAFMVPARIVVLDEMPRLPGGKVDAVALAARAGPPRGNAAPGET